MAVDMNQFLVHHLMVASRKATTTNHQFTSSADTARFNLIILLVNVKCILKLKMNFSLDACFLSCILIAHFLFVVQYSPSRPVTCINYTGF